MYTRFERVVDKKYKTNEFIRFEMDVDKKYNLSLVLGLDYKNLFSISTLHWQGKKELEGENMFTYLCHTIFITFLK